MIQLAIQIIELKLEICLTAEIGMFIHTSVL